jgi:hypothetical protein
MYEANMNGGDNQDQALATSALAALPVKQGRRRGRRPYSLLAILTGGVDRSEPPARRYWLRCLDAPFARAFRSAGALDVGELATEAPRILRCAEDQIDIATIEEWWEFSVRRGWLEATESGSLWRLTERARADLREERERINNPDPVRLAGNVARWALPTGIAGAVGIASGKHLELGVAILVVVGAAILGLLLAAGLWGLLEPRMDRSLACRACDWLEGRRIWPARGTNRGQAEFSRLYEMDA